VFDVDGVLTDGRLYFLEDGSEFKTFNTLDGQGIKMLMAAGVQTAIISGRKTRWSSAGRKPRHPAPVSGPRRQTGGAGRLLANST
jgi:hypothetical protein